MKARLHLDQFCDVSKVTPELQPLVSWVPGLDRDRKPTQVAVYKAGTIFDGAIALQLCKTGQAAPADDEAAKALGWSEQQIESQRVEYQMNAMGINNKGDRDLFRAGVIVGYHADGQYKPGPNWEAYHRAILEQEDAEI